MTASIESLQIWLYSFCSNDSLPLEAIIACLNRVEITVNRFHPTDSRGSGIILLSNFTLEICEFISKISRNGVERILVLATNRTALTNGDVWQILQAGASDVLVWSDLPDPGKTIAALFHRWHEVDMLVDAPVVRNHLIGESRVWKAVLNRIVEVACFTKSPVLLFGETGTGKELVARLIHTLDRQRSKHELVVLDCTTIVPELSGSELFGHVRGAFTGAVSPRDGAFALAHQGTLFLDEVGELPLGLQVQLLRVLQEHTYKPVGSNTWRQTDFRFICATNRDLRVEEAQGRFRRDLYYRVAAWTIKLPPLRERVEDIIPLVRYFIQQERPGQEPPDLDERIQEYFLTREYPGNVRDLRNLVHRVIARHVGPGPVSIGNIPSDERPAITLPVQNWCDSHMERIVRQAIASGAGLREIKRAVEEVAIRMTVDAENGNLQRAAERLGVTDRTLQKWWAEQYQRLCFITDSQELMAGTNNSIS